MTMGFLFPGLLILWQLDGARFQPGAKKTFSINKLRIPVKYSMAHAERR